MVGFGVSGAAPSSGGHRRDLRCVRQVLTEGVPPMALSQSAVSELLEAFRTGEGVDLIRESVRMVMQELIEAEATERIGAGRYERSRVPGHRAQRLSCPVAGHPGRRCGAADPQAAQGVVLPGDPRAPSADRPGAVCGGDGGLRVRGLHPVGRRPGRRARDRLGDLQVGGVTDLRRPGRGRHRVPHPAAGPHRLPLRLPGRDLPACAQHHLPGGLHGRGGGHRDPR